MTARTSLDNSLREKIRLRLQEEGFEEQQPDVSDIQLGEPTKGSVMSLNPSLPALCTPNTTVYDASQIMALTKENCVLAIDDSQMLSGIFTAKDLAYRVVAVGKDSRTTPVKDIMTSDPLCAKHSTPAADALNLMVVKSFRHLPIVDSDTAEIVGLLDISKCYNRAIALLDKMYNHSQGMCEAIDNTDIKLNSQKRSLYLSRYLQEMRKVLSGPSLKEVIGRQQPTYINSDSSVTDAAKLMKARKTTAVLVKSGSKVVGIFTSKDIVLRVIGAGLSPYTCAVSQVMTPDPCFADAGDSISHALQMMADGGYLNLPVEDKSGEILGVTDVITLTRRSLIQIQAMKSFDEEDDTLNSGSDTEELFDDVSESEMNRFTVKKDFRMRYTRPCYFKLRVRGGDVYRLTYTPSDGFDGLQREVASRLSATASRIAYMDGDEEIEIQGDADLRDCVDFVASRYRSTIELVTRNKRPATESQTIFTMSNVISVISTLVAIYAVTRKR